MALEIHEIGIRLQVLDTNPDAQPAAGSRPQAADRRGCDLDRDEIVERCVRRVLQTLKGLGER